MFSQQWNKLDLALVTCYLRQTRMPSHYSLLLRDKPVCYGFLEKVHSIPVCLWFKAWKEKNKCWVLSPRFVILPGSGLLTTLGSPSPWILSSTFPHYLLSGRPASIPRWNVLKKVTAMCSQPPFPQALQGLEKGWIWGLSNHYELSELNIWLISMTSYAISRKEHDINMKTEDRL